jgi:hypothetical protein
MQAMPWLRPLFASLSLQKPGFNTNSIRVGFVVDKLVVRQFFLRVFPSSAVNMIPPMFHAHSFTYHCGKISTI